METSRRQFLAIAGGVLAVPALPALAKVPFKPADVNATEDLMREHGVLRRVLLIYDEGQRQLAQGQAPVQVLASAAALIQHFIEGYHELLEERFIFPRFAKHPTLGPLVATLQAQHLAGRKLTQSILDQTKGAGVLAPDRARLADLLARFNRMYAPHAAREDTDLFPAFHNLFDEKAFDALGDQFEDEEHKALGDQGFEGAVQQVAQLEQALGIGELASFTPKG